MFTSLITNKLAAMGVAGALTLGVLGGGVAYAQSSGTSDPAPAAVQEAAKQKPGIFKNLMADIIKHSGLSKDVFKTGFQNGQSIDAILAANNVNAAGVKAAVTKDVDDRIDAAVKANKLTPEQATKLKGEVPGKLEKLFAAAPKHKPGHGKVQQVAKHELQTVATVLNRDPKALAAELKTGKTIAEIAGPQKQAVIDALVKDANDALDKALASGKINQQQHDKAAANVTTRVTNFVNKAHVPKSKN